MGVIRRSRGAQWPLVQEYVFNYNDGFNVLSSLTAASQDANPRPTVTDFGSHVAPAGMLTGATFVANTGSTGGPYYVEMFSMPNGAQIIGGDLQVEVPFVGPSTLTLALGDINSGTLYLAATTLKASALGNAATTNTITNATAGDPTLMTVTFSAANHGVVVGNIITISGCTGASALYNGTFTVDTVASAVVTCRNVLLTTSLTIAGSPVTVYTVGRTALNIPGEATASGSYASVNTYGYDAANGAEIRGTLTYGDTAAATQGRARVRVMYTIDGRVNEVQTT